MSIALKSWTLVAIAAGMAVATGAAGAATPLRAEGPFDPATAAILKRAFAHGSEYFVLRSGPRWPDRNRSSALRVRQ